MKARKRNQGDADPAIETRNEPSAGILPGTTHHVATNDAAAKTLIDRYNQQARQLDGGQWLDAIEEQIIAMTASTAPHEVKRKRYVDAAEAYLIALRRVLTASDADAAAWHSFQLSRALDRAAVTTFEPPAAKGQEMMIYWRGDYVSATPTERAILEAIGESDSVSLADVFLGAWSDDDEEYLPNIHRSKVDKALSLLNRKLPIDAQLHIRAGEMITVG